MRGFERVAVSRDASFQRAEDARGGDGAVVGVARGGVVLDVTAKGVFDLGAGEDVRELRLHGDARAVFALEASVELVVGALVMRAGRLRGLGAAGHLRQLELPLGHRLGVVLRGHVPRSGRAVHVIHGSRAGVERARGIERIPRSLATESVPNAASTTSDGRNARVAASARGFTALRALVSSSASTRDEPRADGVRDIAPEGVPRAPELPTRNAQ